MPRIHSLPTELLLHILTLAGHCVDTVAIVRTRYPVLRITALVCPSWRRHSQELLWEVVYLHKVNFEGFLVGTAATGFRPTILRLSGPAGFESVDASFDVARAIAACPGLEELDVFCMECMDSAFLFKPELADLKRLKLDVGPFTTRGEVPLVLPFNLSRLFLLVPLQSWPPSLLPLLFQPTLTSLRFSFSPTICDTVIQQLLALAPNLITLSFTIHPDIPLGDIRPLLQRCVALRHFRNPIVSSSRPVDWVAADIGWIPTPLDTCTFAAYSHDFSWSLTLLRTGAVAVSKLRKLSYLWVSRETAEASEAWDDLRRECERRGTELVFRGEE